MRCTTVLAALSALLSAHSALGEPISYQGRFEDGGSAPSGDYQVRFRLFGTASGGSALGATVTRSVTLAPADNGLFAFSDVDFGDGLFTGEARWIEVAVKKAADADFTLLSPRQPVGASPYSVHSVTSETTLDAAFRNGTTINNIGQDPVVITGILDMGSPTASGYLRLYMQGTNQRVLQFGSIPGLGGQARWFDENSVTIGLVEGDPQGEGLSMRLFGDGSVFEFDGDTGAGLNSGARFFVTGPASGFNLNTGLTGDTSLDLPGSSVWAPEVGDEPGLASMNQATGAALTGTIAPMISRSITVPGPGFVLALANGSVSVTRTTNMNGILTVGVSDLSNEFPDTQQMVLQIPPIGVQGQYNIPMAAHGVFEVAASGTYTYYFNGRSTGFGNPQVFDTTLTLIYLPTSYGTVTPTLLAPDGGYAIGGAVRPTRSADEILLERLAEQERALEAMRGEQAAMKAALDALKAESDVSD